MRRPFAALVQAALLAIAASAAPASAQSGGPPPAEADLLARVAAFEREGTTHLAAYVAALIRLSGHYINQGRHADAVPVLRRAHEAAARIAGPDHPTVREIRATLLLAEAVVSRR